MVYYYYEMTWAYTINIYVVEEDFDVLLASRSNAATEGRFPQVIHVCGWRLTALFDSQLDDLHGSCGSSLQCSNL